MVFIEKMNEKKEKQMVIRF